MYMKHLFSSYGRGLIYAALDLLAVFAISVFALSAHADILISPQRAILTDDVRQAVISLHNPGAVARAYRLSWVERRLSEDGQVFTLKDGENPRSIAAMVRFSPRRVTVLPGQTQTVRLDYRPPADLKPGEYRSHLRIGMEPIEDNNGVSPPGTEVMRGEKDGVSFRLDALMSFSVPIFVRHGAGSADVKIAAVEPVMSKQSGVDEPGLNVRLSRSGEFSSYGRLMVYHQLNANAPVELIGEAGAVAIYAEVNGQSRVVKLKPGARLVPGSWVRGRPHFRRCAGLISPLRPAISSR
jgi:P pilus assembly chaperone PapD